MSPSSAVDGVFEGFATCSNSGRMWWTKTVGVVVVAVVVVFAVDP